MKSHFVVITLLLVNVAYALSITLTGTSSVKRVADLSQDQFLILIRIIILVKKFQKLLFREKVHYLLSEMRTWFR